MKRILVLIATMAVLSAMVSCTGEKSVDPIAPDTEKITQEIEQSFTEYQATGKTPILSKTVIPQQTFTVQGNLRAFSSRSSFSEHCGDNDLENFEGHNLPPGFVCISRGISSNTNNECYSRGAIDDDISLAAQGSEQMIVLTAGAFGIPSAAVGPNFFAANLVIDFDGDVNGVGMNLLDPLLGPSLLNFDFFGPGGFIGTISGVTTGTSVPSFFAVRSIGTTITRIIIRDSGSAAAQLVDNIDFGFCGDDD